MLEKHTAKGTREITRLDIIMQSLIQHISTQFIEFYIFLLLASTLLKVQTVFVGCKIVICVDSVSSI